MDVLKTISIASVISFILAFFNKEHVKYISNKEKYFNDFLLKFYKLYRENSDIDIEIFLKDNYKHSDVHIPTYIDYLREVKKYDELKKVLIVDYYQSVPSQPNAIVHALDNLISVVDFLYITFVLLFIMTIILLVVFLLALAGITKQPVNYVEIIITIAFDAIYYYAYRKHVQELKENNIYSYNKDCIQSIVNKKIEEYKDIAASIYY